MGYVYRAFDADGRALYVGYTENLGKRIRQHTQSPWFPDLARFVIDRCETREGGFRLETDEIRSLRPIYNAPKFAPDAAPRRRRLCTVEDCFALHVARGLCRTHYDRAYRSAKREASAA
jgi:excinuclease UvrABC nuclease subunit